jgi:hypothetical protein
MVHKIKEEKKLSLEEARKKYKKLQKEEQRLEGLQEDIRWEMKTLEDEYNI